MKTIIRILFALTLVLPTDSYISASPLIHSVQTNSSSYPGGTIPRYEKFEITFQVDTNAQNLQLPYDAAPPAGIPPEIGITVDALFTPDNWQTVYTQPAFYYQEFEDQVKSNREWFYPTGNYSWKVRFAPTQAGDWQYRLVAQDASGPSQTDAATFSVGPSSRSGFVRVSQTDARYFEFENGVYFPGLGYNMNFNHISWNNPVLDNQDNFQIMAENGIQLARIWLSQWGIFDVSWNPWNTINPDLHSLYIPFTSMSLEEVYPGSDVSMKISAGANPCMFLGLFKAPPAVKRNTTYRVRILYKTANIAGPRIAGHPYGFTAKIGDWLWEDGNNCHDPGTGALVTPHQSQNTSGWQTLEGSLTTGDYDFLPYFYLVMENVTSGRAYIDKVWIEEDLGGGVYGPNIVSKPWMAHHYYMEQKNSYAFDKMLALAEQYGIYLRPVILEKNGWIFNHIDYDGNPIPDDPACDDLDPNNDPAECPGNQWFYGNGRALTKTRWLQQAWWRYLQARWGYSTSIHSWELLNEGDPASSLHFTLADELGKTMRSFAPNHHLVSTSFWHSFPRDAFWANPTYGNVDFADVHRYIPQTDSYFDDSAQASVSASMAYGALTPGGAGKPVIRGETGFTEVESEPPTNEFDADTDATWLHNFVWAGLNWGGLIESYWYETAHIYQYQPNGSLIFDHRDQYGAYNKFIQGLPLNNGHYQDSAAVSTHLNLRTWGQKDLVNQRAHLWVFNTQHTWRNVVDNVAIPLVSGNLTLTGFLPGEDYRVEWWDTYPSALSLPILRIETLQANANGALTLSVDALADDVALKIVPAQPAGNPILFLPYLRRR